MKLYIAMLLLGTTINAQDNQEHTQVKTESVSTTGYSTLQKGALITGVIGVLLAAPFTPLVFKENREVCYDALLEAARKNFVNKIKNEAFDQCALEEDRIKHQLSASLDLIETIEKEEHALPFYLKPFRRTAQRAAVAAFSSLCQEETDLIITKQEAPDLIDAINKKISSADIEKHQPIKNLLKALTATEAR